MSAPNYFLYLRKSSEREDRQVQSIPDQKRIMLELANARGIKVAHIFEEAISAKEPGRPFFSAMLHRIKKGEAQGIICWKLDRLSRNPIDGGGLVWALQQGTVQHIVTYFGEHRPTDNMLPISVELGMADQFIRDLSKNTKRGIQSKLEKGWLPRAAPVGYLNDREHKTIIKDPERFPLIRKAWSLLLTGNYTVPAILTKLNEQWGRRTVKRKRSGGGPLSSNGLYKIFGNLFYAGILERENGEQYPGAHAPMISLDEYDQAQIILGRKGKPRPRKWDFPFTGTIRCGQCGCAITAETKTKPSGRTYTYYHCTRQKKDHPCKQPSVTALDLEAQIEAYLENSSILPAFKEWALEIIRREHDKEVAARAKIQRNQNRTIGEIQKHLDELVQMRLRELIDDEEYRDQKAVLVRQKTQLTQQRDSTSQRADDWMEITERAFEFVAHAHYCFRSGDIEAKREILRTVGVKFVLSDKTLEIQAEGWLQPIRREYPALERKYRVLEPIQTAGKTDAGTLLQPVITLWQRVVLEVRTAIVKSEPKVYIPKRLCCINQLEA